MYVLCSTAVVLFSLQRPSVLTLQLPLPGQSAAQPHLPGRIQLDIHCAIESDANANRRASGLAANEATPHCLHDPGQPGVFSSWRCPVHTVKSPPAEADGAALALSVDGYSAAWRLSELLTSSSVLVKQDSLYEEWFYHMLRPYEHMVPLRADLTDMLEQVQWMERHTTLLPNITRHAQALMESFFRPQTQLCYTASLLRAYAAAIPAAQDVKRRPSGTSFHSLMSFRLLCLGAFESPRLDDTPTPLAPDPGFTPPDDACWDGLLQERPDNYRCTQEPVVRCFNERPAPMPFYLLWVESGCLTSSVSVRWRRGGLSGPVLPDGEAIRSHWLVGSGAYPQHQLRFNSTEAGMFGIELLSRNRGSSSSEVFWRGSVTLHLDSAVAPLKWPAFWRAYGCGAVEHSYLSLHDEMLARWRSDAYPLTSAAFDHAKTAAKCGGSWTYGAVSHYGVYQNRIFSAHHRSMNSFDHPAALDFLRSLARKVQLPNLDMFILSEDGPQSVTPDLVPMFYYTALQRQLMLPNYHSMRKFLAGTLFDRYVRCAGRCFAERAAVLYWRGSATGYANDRLDEYTYASFPRFKPALIAAAANLNLTGR